MVILCISVFCSVGSVALILVTYKFRKTPVLKSSSPLFHCITLLGCVIMYSEMIALFPVLSQATCVGVKWTRHMGFCVTYTALYMKLCRWVEKNVRFFKNFVRNGIYDLRLSPTEST